MADVIRSVRDDAGLSTEEGGPMAGIGYDHAVSDLGDGWLRYQWAYDCGCRISKERSTTLRWYRNWTENVCSLHSGLGGEG